jgi:A/G-specific adenine glycosylase
MWQGLGYYSRARNLLFSAKHIYNDLGSKFPATYNEIIKLKGVGDYTASAIASICFEEQTPVLDGNVYRVLSRIFELENPINLSSSRKIFKEKAKTVMSAKRCGDYNQALMDFGSLVCKPQKPLCGSCNVSKLCKSFINNTVLKYPVKTSKNKIKTQYHDYIILTKDRKTLIVKIEDGIWKNLYRFPVCISEKKQSKLYLQEYFKKKYNSSKVKISLINQKFINHKLSHLTLKSRFWNIDIENDVAKGLFVSDFTDFPMPQLMRNFREKYKTKLSIF